MDHALTLVNNLFMHAVGRGCHLVFEIGVLLYHNHYYGRLIRLDRFHLKSINIGQFLNACRMILQVGLATGVQITFGNK